MLQPFGLMLRAKPPRLLFPEGKAEAAPLLAASMLAPVLVHHRVLAGTRSGFVAHFDTRLLRLFLLCSLGRKSQFGFSRACALMG